MRRSSGGPRRRGAALAFGFVLAGCGAETASTDPPESEGDARSDTASPDGGADPEAGPDADSDAARDAITDGDDAATRPGCPDGWREDDAGIGCEPPPLRTDCPEGSFALPSGRCSDPWICPNGWRRIEGGVGCAPPPLREDCPAGTFALPDGTCSEPWRCPEGWSRISGETGCEARLGECEYEVPLAGGRCRSLGFAECGEAPVGAIVVSEFITEALAGAVAGDVVFVPPGDYFENVTLREGVTLMGACTAQSTLLGSIEGGGSVAGMSMTGSVDAQGSLSLTRVSVQGTVVVRGEASLQGTELALHTGVTVEAGGAFDCEACRLTGRGLQVRGLGGVVELRQSMVWGTEPWPDGVAAGVRVDEGAYARLSDTLLSSNVGAGVGVRNAEARLERVVVQGTRPAFRNRPAGAIDVSGGRLVATDLDLTDDGDQGIFLHLASEADLERVVIRDLRETPDATGRARALAVSSGSQLTLNHGSVRSVESFGLLVEGSTSSASLRNTHIRDIRPTPGVPTAKAIGVISGRVDLDSVYVHHIGGQAIYSTGAAVTAKNLVLRDIGPDGNGAYIGNSTNDSTMAGVDLAFINTYFNGGGGESELAFERVHFDSRFNDQVVQVSDLTLRLRDAHLRGSALFAHGADVELERVAFTGTPPDPPPTLVHRLVLDRSSGTAVDLDFAGSSGGALLISGSGLWDAQRISIRQTGLTARMPQSVVGLEVSAGPEVHLDEVQLSDLRHIGLAAVGGGTSLIASDVTIREASSGEVGLSGDFAEGGAGLAVSRGATASVTDLDVNDVSGFGVTVQDSGTLKLNRAQIRRARPGLEGLGAGDGVLVDRDATLSATDLSVRDCAGVGVIVSASSCSVDRGWITGNARGLVRQFETTGEFTNVVITGNRADEAACDQVCTDRPEAPTATDPIPD